MPSASRAAGRASSPARPPRKYESRSSSPCVKHRRVDPVGVLEVGADVGVRVVERRRCLDAGRRRSCRARSGFAISRRRGRDHVGAECQLRVDVGLLVVGGGEDSEVDAEREQQPDDDQAAVDRAPRRPALTSRNPRVVLARPPAARRATAAMARPRSRTSSRVAPIQSSAGAKNMYTDSDSVGLESGFTTAEKPVRAVSQ